MFVGAAVTRGPNLRPSQFADFADASALFTLDPHPMDFADAAALVVFTMAFYPLMLTDGATIYICTIYVQTHRVETCVYIYMHVCVSIYVHNIYAH